MGCCSSSSPLPIERDAFVVVAPADPATQSGPVRRCRKHPAELLQFVYPDVRTLYDGFQRGLRISGKQNCMGTRAITSMGADGKTPVFGPYAWKSYEDIALLRDAVGSALINEELVAPAEDYRLVGLYSKNRYEWVVAEQACNAYGFVSVPLYDTLGAEAVAFVLNQTRMSIAFVEKAEVRTLLKAIEDSPEKCASLRVIVQFENATEEDVAAAHRLDGRRLIGFDDLVAMGKRNILPHNPPTADQVATFCYTSGTTGDPKGAMLTHGNLVADYSAVKVMGMDINNTDVHLSYLPLAHMFERCVQAILFCEGSSIGFYQGNVLKLTEDILALRPTIFPSVPRLFNRFHDKLLAAIKTTPGVKGWLLRKAFATKTANLRKNILTHKFYDAKVFSKVKARMGFDRVRLMVTGSAPIAPHVMDLLRAIFGCTIIEGYGQTECTAAATLTLPNDVRSAGHVGVPLPCNDVKLVSVEDMGYRYDDKFHMRALDKDGNVVNEGDACDGRGEVCYRGPNVFAGYYKNEEKTAEAIDADGWLHSGDIGMWTTDGNLRIIDRKKNIFKLSQGEYVAAEKIENIYGRSDFVMQSFVYGDSLQAVLVAIVVPDPEFLKPWAKANNIPGETMADWVKSPAVKKAILDDMNRVGKENKLKGFEFARDIYLESAPFSVDNDILTPTFKLKRNVARDRYQAQIDAMYAGGIGVVAGMVGLKQGGGAGTAVATAGVEESKSAN